MRTKRALVVLAAVVLLGVGLSGCGSDSKGSSASSSGATSTTADESNEYGGGSSSSTEAGASSGRAVSIKDFAFSPSTLKVEAGAAVTITNDDGTDHTFTLDDKSFDSGHLAPGKAVTHTFDSAGSYSYHCEIHSTMKGTIEVG